MSHVGLDISAITAAPPVLDHRGQQRFTTSAYEVEGFLARQPANIAAARAQEFEAAVARLKAS